jgi:hypothetical protein
MSKNKITVLLVEDEQTLAMIIKKMILSFIRQVTAKRD